MQTIGIDVGKRQHIAAVCHGGEREARRSVLRFAADRSGFSELERWLESSAAPSSERCSSRAATITRTSPRRCSGGASGSR